MNPATLCRLTVAADRRQVDVSVPADVPIALVLPDLVRLVFEGDQPAASDVAVARIGEPPLRGDASLAQQGVRDGDLLVMTPRNTPVAPIFDDVATALSGADFDRSRMWSQSTGLGLTWICATALLAGACVSLMNGGTAADAAVRVVAAFGVAAILLVCAVIAARTYRSEEVSAALGTGAAALAFTGAVVLVPQPQAGGVLFGCALAGATGALTARITGRGASVLAAVIFLAVLAAPAALLGTLTSQPLAAIAAMLAVTGLVGLTLSGRVAVSLSRLPVPALPGPLARGTEPDPEPELPSLADLHGAARRADSYLTGLVSAATLAMAIGSALCAIGGDDISGKGCVLAAVCALLLALRARTFAAAAPAAALLVGAAGLVVALTLGVALRTDLTLVAFGVAVTAGAAALLFGAVLPGRRFSPPARRAAEIGELVVIASVVPLACWVAGLFDSLSL